MTKVKSNNYTFWYLPITLILLFLLLVFFIYKTVDLIRKEGQTAQKRELMEKEISSLNERKLSLENDILKLETEEGKEEIIREKYQVAKEGEKMVIIVEDEKNINHPIVKDEKRFSFWSWVKRIFNKRN